MIKTSHNVDQVEVDVFGEKLSQSEMKQKAKEAQVMAAEAEFNRLNRRVQELEEDLENTETKFVLGSQKLDKAATTADDSDRMKKVLENRAADDEKKLVRLAEELKEAQKQAEDADKMYDETQKKMMETERNLEVSDERASVGEFKIIELEEELKVVANNLRSLEVSEDKANKRESHYKEEIKRLTIKLKQSETRSEFAERSVLKLQKEVKEILSRCKSALKRSSCRLTGLKMSCWASRRSSRPSLRSSTRLLLRCPDTNLPTFPVHNDCCIYLIAQYELIAQLAVCSLVHSCFDC